MNQKTSVFSLLLSSIYVISLFTNISIAHGKRGLDECFGTSLSGEKYIIHCQVGYQVMSEKEIQDSLELFRDFEKSSLKDEVFEAAKQRDIRLAENPLPESPFMKKIEASEINNHKTQTYEEFKNDWKAKNDAHNKAVLARIKADKESDLRPEIKSKVGSIVDGRYRVSIVYINDSDFPAKYSNHNFFQENTTTSYANDWKNIIFTHYLGENYKTYKPELGAVHELVIIKAFVKDSTELESLVTGKPVESITHIASPIGGIEYGEPPVRIKQ